MTRLHSSQKIRRRDVFAFARLAIRPLLSLTAIALFTPKRTRQMADLFAELYSRLWDCAEHSISHQGFTLPSALGDDPVHRVNEHLKQLYGSQFASLSMGGSSGAMLALLTAVLPKLNPNREFILFDDACHQSTIGGLIFGRWKAIRLPRENCESRQTIYPVKFEALKARIEKYGPENFAAIILVLPSYDGFRSPSEDQRIYQYARNLGIPVIVDGAWDALRFHGPKAQTPPLSSICDVWITSPHKRGLTPSSLGCVLTDNESIIRLWDEAMDLGFRSSSVSFVEIMIAEYRLSQILAGRWKKNFDDADRAAKILRARIKDIHPDLEITTAPQVQAEIHDPTHLLIGTQNIPDLDARAWANILANDFAIDIEKATRSSLLLLCGDPIHLRHIDQIIESFGAALKIALERTAKYT
jgi:threonine aldolase